MYVPMPKNKKTKSPFDDLALLQGLEPGVADLRNGAEGRLLGGKRLLALGVERRVLHETVHEHAEVVLHKVPLDLREKKNVRMVKVTLTEVRD